MSTAWLVKYSDFPIKLHCHISNSTIPVGHQKILDLCVNSFSSWCLHLSYKLKDDVFPLLMLFFMPHFLICHILLIWRKKIRIASSFILAYIIYFLVYFYQTMIRDVPRTEQRVFLAYPHSCSEFCFDTVMLCMVLCVISYQRPGCWFDHVKGWLNASGVIQHIDTEGFF